MRNALTSLTPRSQEQKGGCSRLGRMCGVAYPVAACGAADMLMREPNAATALTRPKQGSAVAAATLVPPPNGAGDAAPRQALVHSCGKGDSLTGSIVFNMSTQAAYPQSEWGPEAQPPCVSST